MNDLENFVCNETSICANAKILEQSNPCELIALKCRMGSFSQCAAQRNFSNKYIF